MMDNGRLMLIGVFQLFRAGRDRMVREAHCQADAEVRGVAIVAPDKLIEKLMYVVINNRNLTNQ